MDDILKRLRAFRDERAWTPYHTAENLAKSIVIEASELLENYQFHTLEPDLKNVQEELADVMGYCLLLCDHYGFDMARIMHQKIDQNEKKYPVEKALGNATKYTKFK